MKTAKFHKWLILSLLVTVAVSPWESAPGQSGRDKDKDRKDRPSEKQLDTRLEKAEEALLTEYKEIAREFYKQGDKERSLEMLDRIERIKPGSPELKQMADTIREEMLNSNGMDVEIETNRGLGNPVAEVEEGKPFRITATGDYKLNLTGSVPVNGVSTGDPTKDYVREAPFGALIGLVLTDGKLGPPFLVGAQAEITPKKSGMLYLKVNVPAVAKCTGTIEAHLSGSIKPVSRR